MYAHIIAYYRHLMRRTNHGHCGNPRRGGRPSRTYRIWGGIIDRCHNPNSGGWTNYGARGIVVCDRWRTFENFLLDMGECPPGLSLDRRENHLGYSKANCRWATNEEQANNTTRTVLFTYQGKRMSMKQWTRELGISYDTIKFRRRNGWSLEDTLLTPPGKPRGSR